MKTTTHMIMLGEIERSQTHPSQKKDFFLPQFISFPILLLFIQYIFSLSHIDPTSPAFLT
jgi:hypothetical protein